MSQENCEISRSFEDHFETMNKEIENCEERLVYQPVQEQGCFSLVDHMTKFMVYPFLMNIVMSVVLIFQINNLFMMRTLIKKLVIWRI